MEVKLKLTTEEHKDLVAYCNLNDLLISSVVKDSFTTGFNIERYGLLNASPQVKEKIVEKEEVGKARVIKGKMDDTRTYAMHPSIPKGNIVVVIHPTSGRTAYCKIVDNYTPSQYEGSGIVITPAVAQKMGLNSATSFDVKIKYAAP